MHVYVVHDPLRRRLGLFVEVDEQLDGTRHFLARGLNRGEPEQIVPVAPTAEPPAYLVLSKALARQIVAALTSDPLLEETVTLETWRDFATLVERVMPDDRPTPAHESGGCQRCGSTSRLLRAGHMNDPVCARCGAVVEPLAEDAAALDRAGPEPDHVPYVDPPDGG